MRRSRRIPAVALGIALLAGMFASAGYAVEDSLLGVRIGASYRELQQRFGRPDGIVFGSGGSMMFQTMPGRSPAGLPNLAAQTGTASTQLPQWVSPLLPTGLGAGQSEWVYDMTQTRGIAVGVIISGAGADAVVTDVIVVGYPERLKGRGRQVRTERGVTLESSFADVLRKYGYPPMVEIYAPAGGAGAARTTGTGGTMRAGAARAPAAGARAPGVGTRGGAGAMRAGGGGGRGPGMRGGAMRGASLPPGAPAGASATLQPSYTLELTAMGGPGMRGARGGAPGGGLGMRGGARGAAARGGMPGGAAARGGMPGGAAAGGRRGATLPPLGQVAAGAVAADLTTQAVVNNTAITFSKDCILFYEGISFTLHNLHVVRIHVSE